MIKCNEKGGVKVKEYTTIKVETALVEDMRKEKERTGIMLHRLVEKAWEAYKKQQEK